MVTLPLTKSYRKFIYQTSIHAQRVDHRAGCARGCGRRKEEMRRLRRKGGNNEKVFGCDLLDHLSTSCQENLNKDVYLQDIHCVSSVCKAYFRELPNPLLTYQLYDKYAEAVAIQLEEERLVKIKDVLKELPAPHYKSKDIEASGFNGTAAFMEEPFFRAIPFHVGNISPGDGPPAMRSYHAIIDGTDKRKGSLKGRKWKSIFNLGGRLHDPRRRNKNSAKDKEKTILRPAKSMDSLSSVPYPHEGSRQRAPSTVMSPLAQPSPSTQGGAEGAASSSGGGVGSGYAVTYRRGQGASVSVVSGGGGTQGIYSRLDSHCGGGNSTEALQPPSRSPGLSSKADRRAGIHISGPFSVTVPLHITSGLAFGVLQGGGAERGNHRGGQESGDKGEGREGERQKGREGERQEGGEGERYIQVEVMGEDKTDLGKRRDEEVTGERRGEAEEDQVEGKGGRGEEEVNGDCVSKPSEERIVESEGEGGEEDAENHDNDEEEGEYMDMKGSVQTALDAPDMSGVRNDAVAIDVPFPLMEEDNAQDQDLEPHHGDDEYEDEVEQRSPGLSHDRPDPVTQPPVDTQTQIQTGRQTQKPIHRPLSIDQYGRANNLSLPPMPSQQLDSASDDGPIPSSEARMTPEHLDIDSPDCCDPSVEVLRHSKAEEENRLEAMKLVEEEDMEQDRDSQEKDQADTLTNTCTKSTDIEESCHLVETSIMEEEETPDDIERSLASASASTDCEEASLQTTAEGKDTRVHLKLKDEEEVLKSHCAEEGVISEGYNGDTVSEAEAENPKEHLLTACHIVSCAKEPENIVNEQSEEVSRDSAGDVKEHPEKGAKREREEEKEDGEEKVEEEMEEREDRNGGEWDKQEGEETTPESEGDMGKGEEREVLKEMEKTEEKDVGVRVEVEEKEQGGMIEEEEERIAGDEREVGEEDTKQEEVISEEMMSIVARDDMMESGERKDREGETEGRTFMEEVIETKEDGEMIGVQQKEIMKEIDKEGESKANEEMSAKEEAKKRAHEGVDTMGEKEAAEEGVEKMSIDNEKRKQDLEAQHVLERRERDMDLIKDVVGEGYEEGDKEMEVGEVIREEEGDSIHVVQQETDKEEKKKKGETKEKLQTPTIVEEREEELKEVQINSPKKYEGEKEAIDSKVGSKKGVGRVLVASKQQTTPKVYQARSVPVVPPKPHHCRITALNLRQQQHQRERRETDGDSGKGKVHRTMGQQDKDKERKMEGKPEHDKVSETERGWNEDGEDEGRGKREA
ncbi:unnamed protein product, partial [Coregonus sp. 'balchen']